MIKKFETLAAAAGLAEGGDHQTALELLSELDAGLKSGRPRILTVAKDHPLRPDPIAYALGLADRMHYEALFLDIFTRQPSRRESSRLRDDFQTIVKKVGATLWQGAGPAFGRRHAVLSGDFGLVLQQACRKLGNVALVILQKHQAQPCSINVTVPVFCFDIDRPQPSTRS